MGALARFGALLVAVGLALAGSAAAQAPEAAFVTVEVVPLPDAPDLFGVDFPDAEHGWAVGVEGTILATSDGGRTWQRQVSGVEGELANPQIPDRQELKGLRSVDFTDAQRGWAVGSPNVILSTTDGGQTWIRRQPPSIPSLNGAGPGPHGTSDVNPEWHFRRVVFTSPDTGHIAGEGGTVLTTTDGGQTWRWQGHRNYGNVLDLTFPDAGNGRAVGELGAPVYTALVTADGGATWTPQVAGEIAPGLSSTSLGAVSFTDPQRGHIAGNAGRIFATSDGGRHWTVQRRDTTELFTQMAWASSRRGLVVGSTEFTEGKRASLVATVDGGETWVSRLVPGNEFYDVAFASPTVAFAVGCDATGRERCAGLLARITFPSGAGEDGDGSGGLPVWLIGTAAAVALALVAALVRQVRGRHH